MTRWIKGGVVVLLLLLGACSPESKAQYGNHPAIAPAQRLFSNYVNHGLSEAGRSLTKLEEEADQTAAKNDSSVSQTVADLRTEYKALTDDADSVIGVQNQPANAELKLALRDRLVDLTRTVERTRLELEQTPEDFREAAKLRLSELDKRLYELQSNIESKGLSAKFDSTLSDLKMQRRKASDQISKLEEASGEDFLNLRGDVETDLSSLAVNLTEAESEYESAVGMRMDQQLEKTGNLDAMPKSADPVNR